MSAANALSSDPSKPNPELRAAEPSMEDILASIRRIIADDQSRSLAAASNAYRRAATQNVTPPPASYPPLRPELPMPPAAPAEAMPAGREAPETQDRAEVVEPVQPAAPFSDRFEPAPIAEQAAAAPREMAAPHLNAPAIPQASEEDLSVIAEIVNAGAASILAPPVPAPVKQLAEPVDEPEAPVEDHAAPTVLPLDGFEAEPHVEEAELKHEAPQASAEPLLSQSVGASVEASFQALATSVFMQNTGAVEAMVREMLRPLLKTWLDDNLPTIVERLVRNEIERVARGGRS